MQRLGTSQYRGQRLNGDPHDVVVGLLGSQAASRGLGVEAQHAGARILGIEAFLHYLGPHSSGRPELGHLLEEVVGIEEEGQPAGELVHVQPRIDGSLNVGNPVGQGEGDLLRLPLLRPRACDSR